MNSKENLIDFFPATKSTIIIIANGGKSSNALKAMPFSRKVRHTYDETVPYKKPQEKLSIGTKMTPIIDVPHKKYVSKIRKSIVKELIKILMTLKKLIAG